MILGTILGIANAGLAIGSTIKNAIDQKKKERIAKDEAESLKAQYRAEANQDSLSRSDSQQLLGGYDREAQRQMEKARNMGVVNGATQEAAAATQKAVAEGRADLMSNISADASARADVNNEKARQVEKDYATFQQEQAQAAQESAMNGIINAGNAIGTVVDSMSMKPKTATAPTTAEADQIKLRNTADYQNQAKLNTAQPVTAVSKSKASADLQQTMKGIMEGIDRKTMRNIALKR